MLITPNFSTDEMQCQCGCGANDMDDEFMRMLQALREEAGFPFRLTSEDVVKNMMQMCHLIKSLKLESTLSGKQLMFLLGT